MYTVLNANNIDMVIYDICILITKSNKTEYIFGYIEQVFEIHKIIFNYINASVILGKLNNLD
jgi:hypothetical protein